MKFTILRNSSVLSFFGESEAMEWVAYVNSQLLEPGIVECRFEFIAFLSLFINRVRRTSLCSQIESPSRALSDLSFSLGDILLGGPAAESAFLCGFFWNKSLEEIRTYVRLKMAELAHWGCTVDWSISCCFHQGGQIELVNGFARFTCHHFHNLNCNGVSLSVLGISGRASRAIQTAMAKCLIGLWTMCQSDGNWKNGTNWSFMQVPQEVTFLFWWPKWN